MDFGWWWWWWWRFALPKQRDCWKGAARRSQANKAFLESVEQYKNKTKIQIRSKIHKYKDKKTKIQRQIQNTKTNTTGWPRSRSFLTARVASVKQIVIIIIICPFGCRHQRLPYLGVLHTITRHKYANTKTVDRTTMFEHFCIQILFWWWWWRSGGRKQRGC